MKVSCKCVKIEKRRLSYHGVRPTTKVGVDDYGRSGHMVLQFVFVILLAMGLSCVSGPQSESLPTEEGIHATNLAIITGSCSDEGEITIAKILEKRILKRSSVYVERVSEQDSKAKTLMANSDIVMVIGLPSNNSISADLMCKFGMKLPVLPNSDSQHPEGFAVKSGSVDGKNYVVIAGVDKPGVLYGVGWLLRAMTYLPDAVMVPTVDAMEKPAFSIRGGNPRGPGARARRYGNLRPGTHEEYMETVEDLMLLGNNIYCDDLELSRSLGMLTFFSLTVNSLYRDFPKEWRADGGRSSRFVCPSIPAARRALLEFYDKQFRERSAHDYFTTYSGDSGGCRCDRCMPWGDTYIRLVHEIADLLHKYHPNTKILASNQDLTNEGNQAIFDYLNSNDSSWLYGIRYAPASDEMQTYIRGPVNPRWFRYEGFGPLGNYLKHMHHELPRTTNIVLFSDITHWMQAQYGVPNPDLALAAVYDRRSWNARPRHFHKIGREVLHYTLGDIHYSEGMHDDFNKWFWYRMLWNPHLDAESITKEYCRYWFGPDAVEEAVEAIFLMEETLEKPAIDNNGIARAVELLRSAGSKIPENLLRIDYRWRTIMQKALMDRYIQLELQRGQALKDEAERILIRVGDSDNPCADVAKAINVLDKPLETSEMKAVIEEARRLGEESNKIRGYRVPASFIVETFDLTEINWWKKTLQEAIASEDDAQARNAAMMVMHYDDPGPGGFYDNVGWPSKSEHLVHGATQWGFRQFPGPAKQSHYNLAYTRGRDGRGVTFAYDGLNPDVDYVFRIAVGTQRRDSGDDEKLEQALQADGQLISESIPVPVGNVGFYEFLIPRELTRDGNAELALTSKSELRPYTIVNEAWLMHKETMPWSVMQ